MSRSKLTRRAVTTGLGAASLGAVVPRRAQAAVTLKLGHPGNEANVWHKACLHFAQEVAIRTDGNVEIKVFPNEQLGKEIDLINGIRLGTVDFTLTGESLQGWVPSAALLAVPYAVRDIIHLDKVVTGAVGKKIAQDIEDKAQIKPLAYFARGPRHLTSNRAIKTPADLNGLKIRVSNVPLLVRVWEMLGAKPTPMAFSEVFTSLHNNTIEGQENRLARIKSARLFEVQKYLNRTEHVVSWIYLIGGTSKLGRMAPEHLRAIADAAKAAQAYERRLFTAEEGQLEEDLKVNGMQFVDVDKAAFAAKAAPAVIVGLDAETKAIYEEMVSIT